MNKNLDYILEKVAELGLEVQSRAGNPGGIVVHNISANNKQIRFVSRPDGEANSFSYVCTDKSSVQIHNEQQLIAAFNSLTEEL